MLPPTKGADGNRRYHLHRQLRRKGLGVNVRSRTVFAPTPPTGKTAKWCKELKKYSYQVQLTIF
ncbi:MAG: hypothetical protein JW783_08390 [Bacteroidales bacterium]|nr:hypothetical protein [Bacteroidales bacterium]MBN2749960.1 hypothetical protein [Bacteroidales bacterium]